MIRETQLNPDDVNLTVTKLIPDIIDTKVSELVQGFDWPVSWLYVDYDIVTGGLAVMESPRDASMYGGAHLISLFATLPKIDDIVMVMTDHHIYWSFHVSRLENFVSDAEKTAS